MANLFKQAISNASTVWLKDLLTSQLPKLPKDIDGCNIWFDSLIEAFEARNLTEPAQQKNFLTQVRNAIKIIDVEHPALDVVKFDKGTWVEINNAATDRIADRNTKFISDPEVIVSRAVELISSFEWASIAAGLAVLTGRRSSEVIKTAKFEYKTEYSVIFSGSLKRKGEPVECVFEIPTLCKAELIIKAVSNLRKFLGKDIEGLSIRQISGRYSRAVSKKCDEHFADLVPRRDGEDNLYSHLFRAVYATIASYWYCPATVPEMEYRAAIQGHYQILDEKNPVLRRSLEAGRHYFDYKISDGQGNIDGRLGIKLGEMGVEVIEQFARSPAPKAIKIDSSKEKQTSINNKDKRTTVSKRAIMNEVVTIPRYLISRLNLLAEELDMNQKDTLEALFDWAEVSLSLADILEIDELKPSVLYDRIETLAIQAEKTVSSDSEDISEEEDQDLPFDKESIRDLCSSVKLLSRIVADQKPSEFSSQGTSKKSTTRGFEPKKFNPPIKPRSANKEKSDSTRKRKKRVDPRTTESEIVINHAIEQLMKFNEQEGLAHKDKFRIGIGAIRKMTRRGDGVIRRVLDGRKDEIDQYHLENKFGEYHNSKGKDAIPVNELVPLDEDYLTEKVAELWNN